jgi:hypothetical protein
VINVNSLEWLTGIFNAKNTVIMKKKWIVLMIINILLEFRCCVSSVVIEQWSIYCLNEINTFLTKYT